MPCKRFVTMAAAYLVMSVSAAMAQVVTFGGLLEELNDRAALAQRPDPAYTCRQFSSYDRNATSPGDETWFANADAGQFLRVQTRNGQDEYVMMDAAGPGAVVRIWSANPKGNLRVYIDDNPLPAIDGPMSKMLDAGGLAPAPLAEMQSRGYNLYLPIPYARRCVITSDEPGFYYQVNYRTYEHGTIVESFTGATPIESVGRIQEAARGLLASPWVEGLAPSRKADVAPGATYERVLTGGMQAIESLALRVEESDDWERALRSLVLEIEFDGETTVWAPVSDFFGSGIGLHDLSDRMRWVREQGGLLACGWIMPYHDAATIRLHNFGTETLKCTLGARTIPWTWNERSMHFHAAWHEQREMPTRPMRDWNYVTVNGAGVFVGDTLTITNPVEQWWGEGDEKIYVDAETFPSHFGTGTEDYYGYAWSSPEPFQSPLHAQVRCDGSAYGNTYGTTTVARLRSLDAIPFERGFRFDMEVWHWADVKVSQSVVTYFYASPGASVNIKPDPASARLAPPKAPALEPPLAIADAVEGETIKVLDSTEGLEYGAQGGFGIYLWSRGRHLWVRSKKPGDFIEVQVPSASAHSEHVFVRLTRSWDYAILNITVNGEPGVETFDVFNTEARAVTTTTLDLGVHAPLDGGYVVRFEVVGSNDRAEKPGTYFGIDCFQLEPGD
jgi:D-arabinan exo alpha-(1,3)/(1,5)-arabinofuranosidase (non-reducing end)